MSIDTLREKYVIADKLFEHVKDRCSDESFALIKQAIAFAEEHYALVVHPTGRPYLQYAIEVAINLLDFRLDPVVISAALVYPPPPAEEKVLPVLKKTFKNHKELLALVDDILHLGQLEWSAWFLPSEQLELKGRKEILQKMYRLAIDDLVVDDKTLQSEVAIHFQKKEKQVENLIRMFFASANNIHALIIKLVDRLHFIKLLKDVPQSQSVATNKLLLAKITLAIYAPIADRLGIWRLKSELEDMSFRLIQPKIFKAIAEKLAEKKKEREQYVNDIIRIVREKLQSYSPEIQVEVSGRAKHIYSIYQKMEAKQLDFERINDLLGIRIIVHEDEEIQKDARSDNDKKAEKNTRSDNDKKIEEDTRLRAERKKKVSKNKEVDKQKKEICYEIQAILHLLWTPVTEPYDGLPGRDWIARPKENQYQSLHTTIIINNRMVEVQIRTYKMHKIAEYGAAASHWRYKERKAYRRNRIVRVGGTKNLRWNMELANLQQSLAYDQEMNKPAQKKLLKSRIFAITPEGHVIDLAEGATPLDFAYRIHTNLGNTYMGAKVNGRYVRMDYKVNNGDIIEISTSRTRKGPNPDWLSKSRLDDSSDMYPHPEWLYQSGKEKSDNENEQMYYVFARTRQARHKIRHALKPPNPQT